MTFVKQYKKLLLSILYLGLGFGKESQAYSFQTITDNKFATLMTCSTIVFGYCAFMLWGHNNSLRLKNKSLTFRNEIIKRKKQKNISTMKNLLNEVLSGEYKRRNDIILKDTVGEELEALKNKTTDAKDRRKNSENVSLYYKFLLLFNPIEFHKKFVVQEKI
jgi:hypothetical protein